MLQVFLCYEEAHVEAARRIADRLDRGAEARVTLLETAGETVADLWDSGLSADAIILLLSPQSVPQQPGREPWDRLLKHLNEVGQPPVAFIEMAPCRYPSLLSRKNFYRWDHSTPSALECWVLSLHSELQPAPFVPAELPWFEGRPREIERLWTSLADYSGVAVVSNARPGSGKSALAQAFARRARAHFRDIVWVGCRGRSATSILGDLACKLASKDVLQTLGEHRVLVVLDDLTIPLPDIRPPDGRSSILATTRSAGEFDIAASNPPAWNPLLAASPAERLWRAVSVCRPDCFSLEFAAAVADVDAAGAARMLVEQRYLDPVDAEGRWYRRSALPSAGVEEMLLRHAAVLARVFADRAKDPTRCRELLAEVDAAAEPMAALSAFRFLRAEMRWPEAVELGAVLLAAARQHGDELAVEDLENEMRWLTESSGETRRPWKPAGQLSLGW